MKSKHFLSTLFFGLALLASCAQGFSQDSIPDPMDDGRAKKVSGGYGYALAGFATEDRSNLRHFVGGASGFTDNSLALGGGGLLMIRSFLLGGEGAKYFQQSAKFGNMEAAHQSGWGRFNLGYVLLGQKGFLLYPKVSIGGYKQTLLLVNKDVTTSIDSIGMGTYPAMTMIKKGAMVGFGLGFEWMPGFDESSGSGLVLGLDLGYHLAITEGFWEANTLSIYPYPNVVPTGIFANFHLGFGGWNRN